ncbi:MAG: LPS export ABC transporter permease LptG [Alphaproteobacteria bacterium]|nr:LPS export ABC transporter permease LptG [Alphaproteobacteria bacterium]MDD9919104.1 LPS export ABC transporter permease LptG [Alphaproteobacteria bacterium]
MSAPRFSSTLFFYLCRRYFLTIILTSLLLISFIYLLDVIELMRRLSKNTEVGNHVAFIMAFYKLPAMALQIAPFVMLLGTLISFTRLTRDRELVAVRGAGLPARRFLVPALWVCLGIGLVNIAVMNPLAATTKKKYEQLEALYFPNSTHGLVTKGGQIWLRQPEKTHELFLFAQRVLNGGKRLENVTLFTFSHSGQFLERSDAKLMTYHPQHWQLEHIFHLNPWQEVTWQAEETLETQLTPEVIANSLSSPETLPLWELHTFIQRLQEAGLPTQKHELFFHRQLSMPALLIAMFLLAAPFALRFSRTHGMGQVLLVGLVTGFGFYLFKEVITAYGLSGRLPAAVAAWAPTLVAGLVGIALFLHFREE